MNSKTKSCERCIMRKVLSYESPEPKQLHAVSPAYMTKKIQQLHTQNLKWQNKRKKLAEERKKLFQEKQIQQCTFQPEINPNTSDFYVPSEPFLKRERNWKVGIEKKKSKKRQEKEKEELKKLTFRPTISQTPHSYKDLNKQLTYSNRTKFSQKTYRNIFSDKKKMKESNKHFKQPFEHRRVQSMMDGYFQMNRTHNLQKSEHVMQKSQILELKNPEDFLSLNGQMLIKQVEEKEEIVDQFEDEYILKNEKTKQEQEN